MEEHIVKQLLECGSTDDVEMTNKYGKPYRGHFVIDGGRSVSSRHGITSMAGVPCVAAAC